MIRLSHYPTHLIKIYCTELNLLSSILQYSHRGQRMLLKVVSSGKIRVFMLCLWTCENMCACTMSNPTTLSSLQPLGALTVTMLAQWTIFHHCSRQPSNSIIVAPQSSRYSGIQHSQSLPRP